MTMRIDGYGYLPQTPEEVEKQKVDEIIKDHRDAVVEFLKQKYPEDFI